MDLLPLLLILLLAPLSFVVNRYRTHPLAIWSALVVGTLLIGMVVTSSTMTVRGQTIMILLAITCMTAATRPWWTGRVQAEK